MPEAAPEGPSAESKHLLAWTLSVFAVTFVGLYFAASFLTPEVEPGFAATEEVEALADGTFRITLGVQDRDKWVGLDLGTGKVVGDAQAADLRFRRYVPRVPGGAAALGKVPVASAALPDHVQWEHDVNIDGGLQNPAVARWYEYGGQTHLLSTTGETYALRRTTGQGHALFEIASYYCAPEGSGCMTVRYRLLP